MESLCERLEDPKQLDCILTIIRNKHSLNRFFPFLQVLATLRRLRCFQEIKKEKLGLFRLPVHLLPISGNPSVTLLMPTHLTSLAEAFVIDNFRFDEGKYTFTSCIFIV